MDTGTHFAMGFGLAGLAQIDPAVAHHPSLTAAVMIGTVVGSQAPDFDGITRFWGNAAYIRNHRGITHSIPAVFLWTFLISGSIYAFEPSPINGWPLAYWTFIAIGLHVFIDLFNAYGTQALRPFSNRWISWNILNITDPFILIGHLIALGLWAANIVPPQMIFPSLYGALAIYLLVKAWLHHNELEKLKRTYALPGKYTLIPTVHWNRWNVVLEQMHQVQVGELKNGELNWVDQWPKQPHPAIQASVFHPDIESFLYFTEYAFPKVEKTPEGYLIRWMDVRYRSRKHYPFVAAALLDNQFHVLETYIGWVYSEEQISRKLHIGKLNLSPTSKAE